MRSREAPAGDRGCDLEQGPSLLSYHSLFDLTSNFFLFPISHATSNKEKTRHNSPTSIQPNRTQPDRTRPTYNSIQSNPFQSNLQIPIRNGKRPSNPPPPLCPVPLQASLTSGNPPPQKQAPSAPTKRKPLRLKATERLANPLAPRKVHRPDSAVTDGFLDTKADKQRIRHAAFVSRITKPSSTSSSSNSKKNARRHARRREQQLSASGAAMVDGLADALPALTADEVAAGDAERAGRVRHKSLRSRPGALRRRERVVRGEMERFGVSLAQLAGVQETAAPAPAPAPTATAPAAQNDDAAMEDVQQQQKSASANRFAALRGFISATMEQNPAFAQRDAAAAAAGSGTKGV